MRASQRLKFHKPLQSLSDISEPKCEECKKEVSAERTMWEREREKKGIHREQRRGDGGRDGGFLNHTSDPSVRTQHQNLILGLHRLWILEDTIHALIKEWNKGERIKNNSEIVGGLGRLSHDSVLLLERKPLWLLSEIRPDLSILSHCLASLRKLSAFWNLPKSTAGLSFFI